MTMLDSFIGKIRSPYYAQLTLDARTGKLVMTFAAQSENGLKSEFTKEYDTQLITGQAVTDLLGWLRQSAMSFWGNESGGL